MNYRPEIDGLRAVGILAVLLYHAGLPIFPGGYVGVDIFFVISGYLITRILLEDLTGRRFSLKKFYERRCRRILPALFFMAAVVTVLSWIYLLPVDFKNYGRSLAATSTFWANIFFWRSAGYFDTQSFTKPLLHCWSLSVEEQFYIFFPLILWLYYKISPRRLWWLLAGTALVSLWLGFSLVRSSPVLAFYWLHPRAWELLAGALVAAWPFRSVSPDMARLLAWPAVLMMLLPILFYSSATAFPGLAAVPPCLGSALLILIHNGGFQASAAGRWLAWPLMRGIGKISYSLYLWHWPLLVIPRYVLDRPLSPLENAAAVAVSLIMAYVSWRWVENPVRAKKVLVSRRTVFVASLAAITLFTVSGRIIRSHNGFPERLPPEARLYALTAEQNYRSDLPDVTYVATVDGVEYEVKTWPIGPEGAPRFLVWGDSHAGMWQAGVEKMAEDYQIPGLALYSIHCVTLPDDPAEETGWNCHGYREATWQMIKALKIPYVFIATRYSGFFDIPVMAEALPGDQTRSKAEFSRRVSYLTKRINEAGAEVWFIENVPEYTSEVANMLARNALAGRPASEVGYPTVYYENRSAAPREALRELVGPDFHVLSVQEEICPGERCLAGNREAAYYTDSNHLSYLGALHFRRALAPMFEAMKKNGRGGAEFEN